jgi:hypothetical protein
VNCERAFGFSRDSGSVVRMQPAIQSVVDVYVRYGNGKALDDLRAHRGRLVRELWGVMSGPYDVSAAIAELENDIAAIEAGMARLNSAAAA